MSTSVETYIYRFRFSFSASETVDLKKLSSRNSSQQQSFISSKPEEIKLSRTMSLIPSFFGGKRSNVFDPFSLDIWDPFEGFPLSATLANLTSSGGESSAIANTRVDWKETPQAHVFNVDLPGLKKEEVKVEVEDGKVLQISGERSREKEEKDDRWHRVERSTGKFMRRFWLPENAKVDQVKAAMENGVLTVTVPKEEENKPQMKSIQISG